MARNRTRKIEKMGMYKQNQKQRQKKRKEKKENN